MNEISIENHIIVVSTETIIKLFSEENGSDCVALYMFYHKQCKLQQTNQSFTVSDFAKKGLKWGDDRFKKAKRVLRELGLIDDIRDVGADGKVKGWYIKINFMKSPPPLETTQVEKPRGGFQETNAGSSININAGSSIKEISTIVDKEQALEAPKEYGKKEINTVLSFLSNTIGIDEFKEPIGKQRQYANHIVQLAEKIGKAEFVERLKGVLSDSFKKKNCNSIAYLYRELKSFIHEEKSLVPTEKKVINSIGVL